MHFDLAKIAQSDAYKLLVSTVVPRPIALATTVDAAGQVNAAPFSFFNAVSSVPPVVVLGISPGDSAGDGWKDTERNIRDTGEFVVNLVDEALAERILRRNDCAWFGLIGSLTKRRMFERRMERRGMPAARFAAMTCPIGVPGIPGKEPAVIAVAVAAELLQVRARAVAGVDACAGVLNPLCFRTAARSAASCRAWSAGSPSLGRRPWGTRPSIRRRSCTPRRPPNCRSRAGAA